MELKDLLATKEPMKSWVDFRDGIQLLIQYIPRPRLQKLIRDCRIYKYDSVKKTREETIDGEKLTEVYCRECVKDWKGMTVRSLSKLLPVQGIEEMTEETLDKEIPFSQANLQELVSQTYELDSFIQEASVDLKFFRPHKEEEEKNSETSQDGS